MKQESRKEKSPSAKGAAHTSVGTYLDNSY